MEWLPARADVCLVQRADLQSPPDREPTAVVFLQARPGSLAQDDIEQFHHLVPLARLLAIVGPWCAGEPRSGRPCEGITRIYWHQWQARLAHELGLSAQAQATGYRSRTVTETDLLLRSLTPALHRPSPAGLVAIATTSRESFSSLADACWTVGLRSDWQQPNSPPHFVGADLLLIDGWESCPQNLAQARSTGQPIPPTVLLADWPHPDDIRRATTQGIDRVLARPLLLTDLFATIEACRGQATNARPGRQAA
jgi:hypothetical protein